MTNASASSSIDRVAAWICWYASTQDAGLTSVQLVKYLYLADLYHARRSGGATISGWPWAFVHFGPYCTEAAQTLDRVAGMGLVQAQRYDSRYGDDAEFTVYRGAGPEPAAIDSVLSLAEMSELKKMIKKWASDTAGLLDYVYFDTEPMTGAQPSQRLDFSKARLPARPAAAPNIGVPKLPEKKKRRAREAIAKLAARTAASGAAAGEGTRRDADYARVMDSDVDRETPPAVSVEFDVTKLIMMALDDS